MPKTTGGIILKTERMNLLAQDYLWLDCYTDIVPVKLFKADSKITF